MAGDDARFELGKECKEDGESDRLNGLPIFLAVVTLDATDEPLYDGRLRDCERKVSVDMEGTNGRQVALNGFGLNSAGKARNPRHDGGLCGGQDGAISVVQAMEFDVINE